jgi:NAD-dependent SIR2 family protein deacetylase
LEGICPKCGSRYYGWSLDNPAKQKCEKCGGALTIIRDGVITPNETQPLPDSKPVKFLEVPPI